MFLGRAFKRAESAEKCGGKGGGGDEGGGGKRRAAAVAPFARGCPSACGLLWYMYLVGRGPYGRSVHGSVTSSTRVGRSS